MRSITATRGDNAVQMNLENGGNHYVPTVERTNREDRGAVAQHCVSTWYASRVLLRFRRFFLEDCFLLFSRLNESEESAEGPAARTVNRGDFAAGLWKFRPGRA